MKILRLLVPVYLCCATAFAAEAASSVASSPAAATAKRFLRGANFGNWLEAPPGQDWGAKYAAVDFTRVKAEGFDHVRLPVAWHHHAGPGPEFKISKEFFATVDRLVADAAKAKLGIIVNLHHFDAFTTDPVSNRPEIVALWSQIAGHYASAPGDVVFELLNEPKDKATTEVMNPVYGELIATIRKTNPGRTIFVGPGLWNQVSELKKLKLPENDRNLIVTVHCYDPFNFTHQGATWAGEEVKAFKGIVFPGPPAKPFVPDPSVKLPEWTLRWIADYNTKPAAENPCGPGVIVKAVDTAAAWSREHGRPVHFGEFGAYIGADRESRIRFYRTFRENFDRTGLGWAIWDWKAGFRYWDDKAGAPVPGMREALFPAK